MKWYFYIAVLCLSCVCSCKERIDNNASQTSNAIPQTEDSSAISQLITDLGDLIYDQPDTFLLHEDSIVPIINGIVFQNAAQATSLQFLHLNVGYVYRQNGQILKAINAYEKAIELYFKFSDTSINFTEYYVKPLGSLYTMTGDLQKASDLQWMDINNPKTSAENKASLYANLAITTKQQEQFDSAIQICKKGLLHTKNNSTTALRLYNEITANYIALAQYDSAEVYNALSQNISSGNHDSTGKEWLTWASTTKSNSARLAQHRGNNNLAYQFIAEAIALLENNFPNSHQREKAKLYLTKANILKDLGNHKKAIENYQIALQLINPKQLQYFPDNTVTDCYAGIAFCSTNENVAIEHFQKAIENDYIVQQFIKTKESNYLNSAQSRNMLKSASALLYRQYTTNSDAKNKIAFTMLWLTELFKGRQLLNEQSRAAIWQSNDTIAQQIKSVQNQLRFLYETLAQENDKDKKHRIQEEIRTIIYKSSLSENVYDKQYQQPNMDTFIKQIAAISQSKDIISWQINDDSNSYVIAVHKGIAKIELLTNKDSIQHNTAIFYNNYFSNGPELFNNDPQGYFEASALVLKQIVPNVNTHNQDHWLLSKDGFIYGLPIEALTIQDQYLIEKKSIQSVYTLFNYSDAVYTASENLSVNIFAKSEHEAPFQDLKYIDDELKSVSNTVSAKVYKDKAANFEAFQNALNSPDIMHISTHAIADKENQPFIVLDEKINLDKLEFTLTQSPLVVLSACETANGLSINGEGLESINKAFLSKGVKGVIAAQWNVNDAFVPKFMQSFYANLMATKSPDIALRKAQLDYIKSKSGNHLANPWEWASLGYTGDNIMLQVSKSQDWTKYLWWALVIIPLGAFSYVYTRKRNSKNRKKGTQ